MKCSGFLLGSSPGSWLFLLSHSYLSLLNMQPNWELCEQTGESLGSYGLLTALRKFKQTPEDVSYLIVKQFVLQVWCVQLHVDPC